ncbi:magnesium chelatase subunit D [Sulfitobacter sp. JB4-11]|uniref:magnesium chelatase subunit D n=1 Tax=Sulfitobacter rhodophyticola TaxID=3238304 RepID=UPI0035149C8B
MTPFGRATTALRLLAVDPARLGGMVLRARSGPARDAVIAMLPQDTLRLHPALPQDALDGGVDVAASLAQGQLIHHRGLLHTGADMLLLTMAERTPPLMATTLANALETGSDTVIIALDEGTEDDDALPHSLSDRLAFHVTLEGLGQADVEPLGRTSSAIDLAAVETPEHVIDDLVTLAVSLGIDSLRAPYLALCAAQAHAALSGRRIVAVEDITAAAELVLAPRATRMPAPPDEQHPPPPPEEADANPIDTPDTIALPDDILLDAIRTALPPDLLSKTGSNTARNAKGSGAGRKRIGNRRGRPLPARDGAAKGAQPRVDLMATLRAAIPWQGLRRRDSPDAGSRPLIRPADLRYRRYQDLSDRLLVFAVDASGSAAMARLAEAKGAVELLLAEAYARRDHVALISFRGTGAELLLSPTRSLVQTKRRLAALPGGGGTPLASGLEMGLETARTAERRGLTPVLVVLTDGRSNIALDGSANREQAAQDAARVATQIATAGIDSIVIDCGRRPDDSLSRLSLSLRGHYVSLPRADAQSLSKAVTTALES